jgi:hypothetical protein
MGGVRSVARAPASMERESEQNMEALFELCILLFPYGLKNLLKSIDFRENRRNQSRLVSQVF